MSETENEDLAADVPATPVDEIPPAAPLVQVQDDEASGEQA